MRAAAPLLVLVAALVASTSMRGATSSTTSLRVTYWEDAAASSGVTWTLHCAPPGGSLERPGRACMRLAAGGTKLFAPLRPDSVCTEIYGGPQKARVVGTVDGKHVWTTFTRRNGCEIDRWRRISPWLVPPGGVT